jgi:Na+/H+-dicarboxylate symporter
MACGIAVMTNVGVIGLPGAAVLFAAYSPVFAALGTPLEMIALLIPVFTLPDMLDTGTNVTADLAATAIVARIAGAAKAVAQPALA